MLVTTVMKQVNDDDVANDSSPQPNADCLGWYSMIIRMGGGLYKSISNKRRNYCTRADSLIVLKNLAVFKK